MREKTKIRKIYFDEYGIKNAIYDIEDLTEALTEMRKKQNRAMTQNTSVVNASIIKRQSRINLLINEIDRLGTM